MSTKAPIVNERLRTLTAWSLGDLGDIGEVDVAAARAGELRPRRHEDFEWRPIIEREAIVAAGLRVPEVDELAQFLRVLGGEIVELGPVHVRVIQLPRVVTEVAPAAERRDAS